MIRKYFVLFIIIGLLFSCTSQQGGDFTKAPLQGMIYDSVNQPCNGVTVKISGYEKEYMSDINGRLVVPQLGKGTFIITAEKENYEKVEMEFDFTARTQILYIKMFSFDHLIQLAEEELANMEWEKADGYLQRAEKIDEYDPSLLYLQAVLLRHNESYDEAIAKLKALIMNGYESPYVHLLLADIYQYDLEENKNAYDHLLKSKGVENDSDIEKRISEIESTL